MALTTPFDEAVDAIAKAGYHTIASRAFHVVSNALYRISSSGARN